MLRTLAALALSAGAVTAANAQDQPAVNPGTPAPDCHARVNYNLNKILPGYVDARGICQPFTATYQLVPATYGGRDYYGEEFTDAKIRQRWAVCKQNPACAAKAMAAAQAFTSYESRDTGTVDLRGRIEPEGDVDLADIRRPAYFGHKPYDEPIGKAEGRTYTIEFTVPRDSFERLHLDKHDAIKLRGWYLKGDGVRKDDGVSVRALVIMNNGGGGEITAIDAPGFEGVVFDAATKKYSDGEFPDGASEEPGMRHWRGFIAALNDAGFDVLVTDRRGNGISGGVHGFDTAEQAEDMFRELDEMRSGDGLRLLTPGAETLSGRTASNALFAADSGRAMPVVLAGYSRGSYATAWAMQKNFVADCDYDLKQPVCAAPKGNRNIKGAILYGPNAGGLGYRAAGHDMQEAALRTEFNTTYRLDSSVLTGIAKWPGVAIIKGTWGYPESLEGSFEAFKRAKEPKEIFVFHGPHQLPTQAPENMAMVGERMVAFARAAVLGRDRVTGAIHPNDLRALVLSSPDYWELTTKPTQAGNDQSER